MASLQVTHFTVPVDAYPRYKYTRKHATPLFERFSTLLTECALTDLYPKPVFEDVDIYVVLLKDDNRELVTASDLPLKRTGEIEQRDLDIEELKAQTRPNKASIFIASYTQTKKDDTIVGMDGHFILLLDADPKAETPECQINKNIMLTVKKESLSEQICLLLERIVLREFRARLDVLDAFMDIDEQSFFANMDQDIKSVMEKYRPSSLFVSSRVRNEEEAIDDNLGLAQKYYLTRKDKLVRKINTFYKKDLKEIRDQLLTTCISETVDTLTVCEAIESREGQADRIRELMADVKRYQDFAKVQHKTDQLESNIKNHLRLLGKQIETVEHIRGEMIGMYKRSKIPDRERPSYTLPILKPEVAKEIVTMDGVTGCGYRYTTLDVFFRDTLSTEDFSLCKYQMTAVMSKHNVLSYRFRQEQEVVTVYAEVGTQVTSHLEKNASIGGFAKKGEKKDLCVLLARHFAPIPTKPIYEKKANGDRMLMAHVLDPNVKLDRPLDIAAAGVINNARRDCQTQFRDEDRQPSNSRLVEFGANDLDFLVGLPVHLWGAASKPGYGKITSPDYYIPGMVRLVRIEDRHQQPGERFAKAGDSGAIVCADHPDGEFVHVVAMLMGSPLQNVRDDEKKEYTCLRLVDGMHQLQTEHNSQFVLC